MCIRDRYISYLDLSVIFCVFPEETERGILREFRITRGMLSEWQISGEQLAKDAIDNTKRRYRYIFRDLNLVTEAVSEQAGRFFIDPAGVIESVPEGVCLSLIHIWWEIRFPPLTEI